MFNDLLYIAFTVAALAFTLTAFKLGQSWLFAFVAACVTLMNIFVLKQIDLFGLSVTGGNVLYSSVFLATDLLSEHYGKRAARRAVHIGFFVSVFFVAASQFMLRFEPNAHDFAQGSFATIFDLTPRIVAASMIAYLASQHLDIVLFEAIRRATRGRYLWLRNNGSTFVSQAVDSMVFNVIAFYGIFETGVLLEVILFTYLVKLIVAVLDTPFIYLSKLAFMRPPDAKRTRDAPAPANEKRAE